MKKRLFIIMLAALLCFAVACSSSEAAEETPTPEPTATPEPTEEPTPTPEPTATPEPTEEPESETINVLTGLDTLTEEAVGKRPVAVMINNIDAALPQYGISDADIIFEIPVEGNLTRLMAMYGDYTQMGDICSVRSCRYYYPILAVGFDAIYVHWGTNETLGRPVLDSLDIDRLDGNEDTYGLFFRDQSRLNSGYSLEHTGAFSGGELAQALADNGVRTDLKEDKQGTAFQFAAEGETVTPSGQSASEVWVYFGANYSGFTYDEESGEYLKTFKDSAHIDGNTGEQLSFENVIILETDITTYDDSGIKEINWQGGDGYTGWYISNGAAQRITWSKADEYSYLRLFDENGEELTINRGKSYIALAPWDSCSIYE